MVVVFEKLCDDEMKRLYYHSFCSLDMVSLNPSYYWTVGKETCDQHQLSSILIQARYSWGYT